MKQAKKMVQRLKANRFDCVSCGLGIAADDEGCCASCGRQTVIVLNGIPDYSGVLAGMEAEETMAARAASPGGEGGERT